MSNTTLGYNATSIIEPLPQIGRNVIRSDAEDAMGGIHVAWPRPGDTGRYAHYARKTRKKSFNDLPNQPGFPNLCIQTAIVCDKVFHVLVPFCYLEMVCSLV